MSALLFSLPLLWAQRRRPAAAPPPRCRFQPRHSPTVVVRPLERSHRHLGRPVREAVLTWLKALGLVCLVCWVAAWLSTGVSSGSSARAAGSTSSGVAALVLTPLTVMIRVLESVKRLPVYSIGSIGVSTLLFVTMAGLLRDLGRGRALRGRSGVGPGDWTCSFIWAFIWRLVLGLAAGLYLQTAGFLRIVMEFVTQMPDAEQLAWREGCSTAADRRDLHGLRRTGADRGPRCSIELVAIRGRRLYSIARLSIYESNRRMWAPWVVITVFLLVLAFTHWFLQPPRAAEMGRLYVGTLTLLCSVLLTVMVTILTPLSLPTDIQQQTIYTVVSKPVRRLELIWGRMIGYMALVTVLVAVFGGISLAYLWRTVGNTIDDDRTAGDEGEGRGPDDATTRSSASRPISSAPGCRPGFRSRARCRSSTRAARRTRWESTWGRNRGA